MSGFDFTIDDIPIPSSNPNQPENEDFKKYWANAQASLQQIQPQVQPLITPLTQPYQFPTNPYYQMNPPSMYGYQGFNLPAYQSPSNVLSAASRFAAEKRLRDLVPGPIHPPTPMRPPNFRGSRGGGPRPSFRPRMSSEFSFVQIIHPLHF
jgi:hypothetical protein